MAQSGQQSGGALPSHACGPFRVHYNERPTSASYPSGAITISLLFAGTSASEPMPIPSGSALNGAESVGAGMPSYQTPGNSLHDTFVSPTRQRGQRDSMGTLGTPLLSPTPLTTGRRNRRESLGGSVGGASPLFSPSPNIRRRPELGRQDGFRQQTRPNRRREPSVPMSNITDDPNVRLAAPVSSPASVTWLNQLTLLHARR